jgi:hypothetical protein
VPDTSQPPEFEVGPLSGDQPDQLDVEYVLELLRQTDALDFNLCGKLIAALGGEVADDNMALGALTTMAHTTLGDPRYWITAIMLAITTSEPEDRTEALAEQLIYFCRDTFAAVLDETAEVVDRETFTHGRALIYRIARRQPYRHSSTYRFHDPDGTFNVLELPA